MSERESMSFDVVIVGAGVAGLAAAIRLKQLAQKAACEISVLVLEKGGAVGAHVLSGAIIDPRGLDQLIPDWREQGGPLDTLVSRSKLFHLGCNKSWHPGRNRSWQIREILLPRLMRPDGGGFYVGSLGALAGWLAEQAEALGVEIYPGFGATELLYDDKDALAGVATADQGLDGEGNKTADFEPGMELLGRYTLLAEGARGFLSQQLIEKFDLCAGKQVQKYALGLKELWQVPEKLHKPGLVEHFIGWPLPRAAGGGGFVYHYGDNLVALGLVVHGDYQNPALSPFDLLQNFKTHSAIRSQLAGGKRIGYGARVIAVGGWQSLPQLVFPGGALLGDAAGMVNAASMKGSDNAILSGCAAATACFAALQEGRGHDRLQLYQQQLEQGEIGKNLRAARNVKPLITRFGTGAGGALAATGLWLEQIVQTRLPVTLRHRQKDRHSLQAGAGAASLKMVYDGQLTFDMASSLHLAGVAHDENQPSHLVFREPAQQLANFDHFGLEPAQYYCPAGVYELRRTEQGQPFVHISPANCLHCKMCDLKDPAKNMRWQLPSSGGPNYMNM